VRLVIADTGPINYLVLIGHIDLLPRMFDRIAVPRAVQAELSNPLAPFEVRRWMDNWPAWLEIHLKFAAGLRPRRRRNSCYCTCRIPSGRPAAARRTKWRSRGQEKRVACHWHTGRPGPCCESRGSGVKTLPLILHVYVSNKHACRVRPGRPCFLCWRQGQG
jgi:hypothetical protein